MGKNQTSQIPNILLSVKDATVTIRLNLFPSQLLDVALSVTCQTIEQKRFLQHG
jgi:hypothetical protein